MDRPPEESRFYVNRNLKLSSIEAIGFDLDHTLLMYHHHVVSRLIHQQAWAKLKAVRRYHLSNRPFAYLPNTAIRGLLIDRRYGNILKVDRHHYVTLARHGLKKLSDTERRHLYSNERVTLGTGRYASLDSLFETPEALLYSQMVHHMDKIQKRTNYDALYTAVREAVDTAHQDGSIKGIILERPYDYLLKDPNLSQALLHLKRNGKRLFILTNSEWFYTDATMSYLLNGDNEEAPHWTDYFDAIFVCAKKPDFYTQARSGAPLQNAPTKTPIRIQGGRKELERILGVSGENVLYFGDHTFGDILGSKKTIGWRTAMILPELDPEITLEINSTSPLNRRQKKQIEERHRIENRLTDLYSRLGRYRSEKKGAVIHLDLRQVTYHDKRIETTFKEILSLERRLTALLNSLREEADRQWKSSNPFWGSPFNAGDELSLFAEQIRDWACIYTSRVSNLLYYPADHYFQVRRSFLPHEEAEHRLWKRENGKNPV